MEQIKNPDFAKLKKICAEYIKCIESNNYVDDDFSHYIFEEAINTLYGKDIWDFINKNLK